MRPHLHPSGPPRLGGTAHLFRPCVRNRGRFCFPGDIWQRLETVVVVATRVGNACRCLAVEARRSGRPPAHWTAPLWATEGRGYLPDQQDTARTGGCGQGPGSPEAGVGLGEGAPTPGAQCRGSPSQATGVSHLGLRKPRQGPQLTQALPESPEIHPQKQGVCFFRGLWERAKGWQLLPEVLTAQSSSEDRWTAVSPSPPATFPWPSRGLALSVVRRSRSWIPHQNPLRWGLVPWHRQGN